MHEMGPNQQTIKTDQNLLNFLQEEVEALRAENRTLENSLVYLQRQNQKLMMQCEQMIDLKKTLKQFSKKLLSYSRDKIICKKSEQVSSDAVRRLQRQVKDLSEKCQLLESERLINSEQISFLKESKGKVDQRVAESIGVLRRRVETLQAENKSLNQRLTKTKNENSNLNNINIELEGKYQELLSELLQTRSKSIINQ